MLLLRFVFVAASVGASEYMEVVEEDNEPLEHEDNDYSEETKSENFLEETGRCFNMMPGSRMSWVNQCCIHEWEGCLLHWSKERIKECCSDAESDIKDLDREPTAVERVEAYSKLQRVLGFRHGEMRRFLQGLDRFPGPPLPQRSERPCWSQEECVTMAFEVWYKGMFGAQLLPMRPQQHMKGLEDPGFPDWVRTVDESSLSSRMDEFLIERRQRDRWIHVAQKVVNTTEIASIGRCLAWHGLDEIIDTFEGYCKEEEASITYTNGKAAKDHNAYLVTPDKPYGDFPPDHYGLVLAQNDAARSSDPENTMRDLFRITAPGGLVVWSSSFVSQVNSGKGKVADYTRWSLEGAIALAQRAGFHVKEKWAPGTMKLTLGAQLGMNANSWSDAEMMLEEHEAHGPSWPLQIHMIMQKPLSGDVDEL